MEGTHYQHQQQPIKTAEQAAETPWVALDASRQLLSWLKEHQVSLGFTTYQVGKLFLIGSDATIPDKLSVFERTFNRCMGLATSREGQQLFMSSLYQLWRFDNALKTHHAHETYDKMYIPQVGYTTGDCDIHDIGIDNQNNIIFVNTLFSCLATTSESQSFIPIWKPPFISKLAAEDRCHLNGLAFKDGEPRYVTMISQTDVYEGWREHRERGGAIMDIKTNQIVTKGLSMPHSPRWYQDKLWVLNSGQGELGYIDKKDNTFKPIAFCPGYARGLSFYKEFAIIGLSKPRNNKTFEGLTLQEKLKEKDIEPRCGIQVININTGDTVHSLNVNGMIEEIYDVATIPNTQTPMMLGFKTDEIRRFIVFDERALAHKKGLQTKESEEHDAFND